MVITINNVRMEVTSLSEGEYNLWREGIWGWNLQHKTGMFEWMHLDLAAEGTLNKIAEFMPETANMIEAFHKGEQNVTLY